MVERDSAIKLMYMQTLHLISFQHKDNNNVVQTCLAVMVLQIFDGAFQASLRKLLHNCFF